MGVCWRNSWRQVWRREGGDETPKYSPSCQPLQEAVEGSLPRCGCLDAGKRSGCRGRRDWKGPERLRGDQRGGWGDDPDKKLGFALARVGGPGFQRGGRGPWYFQARLTGFRGGLGLGVGATMGAMTREGQARAGEASWGPDDNGGWAGGGDPEPGPNKPMEWPGVQ